MIFIIIRKLLWHRNLTFLRLILEEINVWKKFVKSIQKQLLNVIRTTMHWFIVKMRFFSWNQLFHFHCNKSCYKLISRNIFQIVEIFVFDTFKCLGNLHRFSLVLTMFSKEVKKTLFCVCKLRLTFPCQKLRYNWPRN